MIDRLRKCATKKGYRVDIRATEFESIRTKILLKAIVSMNTKHLLIFEFLKKNISLTPTGLILRNCTKEEAESILKSLLQ